MTPHRFGLLLSLAVALSAPAAAADPAVPGSAKAAAPAKDEGMSVEELDKLLDPIFADTDEAMRRAAAKTVIGLGQDAVPAITKKLAELRKGPSAPIHAALKNAKDTAGKQAPDDEVEQLLRAKTDGPGYRVAMSTLVLAQALVHVGTTPAAKQLLKIHQDHNNAFHTPITRLVRIMGDRATAALIETKKDATDLRHWAYKQLEEMGKRIPGDAVQTKDNQALADVLRAYAYVHEMDAIPVILSFVNSDRIQVRSAARDAIGAYGQDAIWKLREAYSNVTGKPAPDNWTSPDVARELFAAYDRLRLQEVYGLLEEGLKKAQEGKTEEAVADFDKVLARQPLLDRRNEMVPTYVKYAEQLEETDPAKALAVFRKAARLWPDGPRANSINAEIAYLEGRELQARGIADIEPFKRALALDPTHTRAKAEIDRLETNVEERESRIRALAAAAAVVFVAIAGIVLFGGGGRFRTRKKQAA